MAIGVAYPPRNPETSVLYRVIAEELETFLARQQEGDRPVPRFVEKELRAFLDCGILARGFLRLHCQDCGGDRLLAFSCKGRVWCPSCGGRRMADMAAHLVDRVFPNVPVRQWVLDAWRRTPGTTGAVRPNDRRLAAALHDRGVPLTAVENAMILAAARRICRPPGLAPLQPMRSLHYIQPVIDEVLELRASPDYFRYLQSHIDRALNSQPSR